jgi:hypothetical protein
MNVPRRRRFIQGRVYYSVQFEWEDEQNQPIVLSYKYTGKTDGEGKHIFDILGAPPGAQMVLEKNGEDSLFGLKRLTKELNRYAS